MKTKKIILFITLLVLLTGAVSAGEVSNDTINTIDTPDEVTQSTGTTIREIDNTLTDEINQKQTEQNNALKEDASKTYTVNDFNTLHNVLTKDTYSTLTLNINSNIILTDITQVNNAIETLTINGNGKTVNGNNTYEFLKIFSGTTVTINNIKITNCYGSAIYNEGILTVSNSTLNKNNASCGGAINNNGKLTINNSTLNNNKANDDGGAIYNRGMLFISNSILNNNNAADDGGAIYNYYNNSIIKNCTLNSNTAGWYGGAICSYEGNLNITRCVLSNNNVNYSAGAIYTTGNATINNSTLNSNSANGTYWQYCGGAIRNYGNLTINNSILNNNKAVYDGGAIYNWCSGNVTIHNSTLNNNTINNAGGAIRNCGNLTITNSSLNNNKADYNGGVIYNGHADNYSSILNINNCIIMNNTSKTAGGAIYNTYGGIVIILNTMVKNNTEGAIYNSRGNMTIYNSTLNDNIADDNGGIIINNVTFGNVHSGGAIFNHDNLIINNCTLNNNMADEYGGAICNSNGNLTMNNCKLNDNKANDDGGAIYSSYSNFSMNNCTFNNNMAVRYGGAIYSRNNLSIKNTIFSSNKANENGGAIYNTGNLTMINTNLNNNIAAQFEGGYKTWYNSYCGGAVCNKGNIIITNNTFNNNMAVRYGGAIYNEYGNITVTKSKFNGNNANSNGGAIYNTEDAIINNNIFLSNRANTTGKAIINQATATISNNTNAETSKCSGTIYTSGTNVTIKNNIFYDQMNVFINSMNVLNGKYVLTTKVSDGISNKLNVGRVSYTLDGKWKGSINVVNGSSWISFDVPSIGNHTIVATYIAPNGASVSSDTFTIEKKAGVNALFNQYNVKNGKVIVVTSVKYDNGSNVNSGRMSYSLNNKWIGSVDVKNGSSWISFNYNDSVVTFKATFITKNNATQNIYTRTLNLTQLKALINNNNDEPLKNSSIHIMINSMNLLNGKYVFTTKVTDDKYVKLNVGRVSYTLNGKWIGSVDVKNGSSWISFETPATGNHSVVATYMDANGKAITTDTYSFVKQSSIAGVNSLFNQYNVKNGKVIIVTAVKNDKGNAINSGRISYSLNGKWIGSVDVKNGSSWISFNYTGSVVTFKATFITNSNVTQNIYTRTLDLDEITRLKQV